MHEKKLCTRVAVPTDPDFMLLLFLVATVRRKISIRRDYRGLSDSLSWMEIEVSGMISKPTDYDSTYLRNRLMIEYIKMISPKTVCVDYYRGRPIDDPKVRDSAEKFQIAMNNWIDTISNVLTYSWLDRADEVSDRVETSELLFKIVKYAAGHQISFKNIYDEYIKLCPDGHKINGDNCCNVFRRERTGYWWYHETEV